MKRSTYILAACTVVLFFVSAGYLLAQEALVGTDQTELPKSLEIILAFLAPLVWQFVTKFIKNEWLKFATTIALSAITGVAALLFSGMSLADFSLDTLDSIGFWSAVAYKLVWKPLLFNKAMALKAEPTSYKF